MRASPMMRSPCWRGSSEPCTSFYKQRRRSPRGCFECGDTTHFIADCPKSKKLDSSNKYSYNNNNQNNSSSKGDDRKKYCFGDKKKKKKKF
jgi:hypothetical protein